MNKECQAIFGEDAGAARGGWARRRRRDPGRTALVPRAWAMKSPSSASNWAGVIAPLFAHQIWPSVVSVLDDELVLGRTARMDAGIGDEGAAMGEARLAALERLFDQKRGVEIRVNSLSFLKPNASGPCAAFNVPITSMRVSFPGNREACFALAAPRSPNPPSKQLIIRDRRKEKSRDPRLQAITFLPGGYAERMNGACRARFRSGKEDDDTGDGSKGGPNHAPARARTHL